MEHDSKCADHDKQIEIVRARTHELAQEILISRSSVELLSSRVPEQLGETLTAILLKTDTTNSVVNELKTLLVSSYVTRTEFEPVKKIIYGIVGIVLALVLTALVALVVTK